MGSNAPCALKIIAIGDGFAAALYKTPVNGEKFRVGARLPALDAGTVCAFLGGINAAAQFEIRESAPVWLFPRRAAVEKLSR